LEKVDRSVKRADGKNPGVEAAREGAGRGRAAWRNARPRPVRPAGGVFY